LPQTSAVAEDRKTLETLSQAYYETSRYLLSHNKKVNVSSEPSK
jgi:hypothetical protein